MRIFTCIIAPASVPLVAYPTPEFMMPKCQMPRIYVLCTVHPYRTIEPSSVRYSERRIVVPGVIGTCVDGAQQMHICAYFVSGAYCLL